MKIRIFFSSIAFVFASLTLTAQESDPFYLEDQIYIGTTYNMLVNMNDSIKQGGFSNGLDFGYIRDIPLNERRNFGLGIGLAYSIGHYYQNLEIKTYEDGKYEINKLNNEDFIRNKFSLSFIEIPFEIRYRTSTADVHKFWRVYLGMKVGYRLRAYAKRKTQLQEIAYYNQPNFNWWRYGMTLKVGHGTWNLSLYYGLSQIFKDGSTANPKSSTSNAIPLKMNELNVGLVIFLI